MWEFLLDTFWDTTQLIEFLYFEESWQNMDFGMGCLSNRKHNIWHQASVLQPVLLRKGLFRNILKNRLKLRSFPGNKACTGTLNETVWQLGNSTSNLVCQSQDIIIPNLSHFSIHILGWIWIMMLMFLLNNSTHRGSTVHGRVYASVN